MFTITICKRDLIIKMDQPIDETRIRVDLFKEVQFSLCEDVIQLEQVFYV